MASSSSPSSTKINKVFKVLVLGEYGVGKTSLAQRFVNNIFYKEVLVGTSGISDIIMNHSMKVDQQDITLQIWDTASQERFRSLTSSFYRNTEGVMIVFDITNKTSFEQVNHWINEAKENIDHEVPIVLVGNKVDCQSNRTVDNSTAHRFSEEVGISYIEASAWSSEGVTEAFTILASKIVAKNNESLKSDSININTNVTADDGGWGCAC